MLGYAKHIVKQCRVPAGQAGTAHCFMGAVQGQCLPHAFLASEHLRDNQDVDVHVQVRRVPVTTEQMGLSELNVKQPKTEQIRTFEASLRLDAIASAGFRISRGKAADLIKHGDVRCGPAFFDPVQVGLISSPSHIERPPKSYPKQEDLNHFVAQRSWDV